MTMVCVSARYYFYVPLPNGNFRLSKDLYNTFFFSVRMLYILIQVRDENKEAEYLCLSHNPFADFIAVGTDNGTIKVYDEKTLQVRRNLCKFKQIVCTCKKINKLKEYFILLIENYSQHVNYIGGISTEKKFKYE